MIKRGRKKYFALPVKQPLQKHIEIEENSYK